MRNLKQFNPLTYEYTHPDRPLLFLIVWDDHNANMGSNWQQLKDIERPNPVKVRTVGWVMFSTKDCITVVSTLTQHGQNLGGFNILKRAIVSVKKIADGPKWTQEWEYEHAVH